MNSLSFIDYVDEDGQARQTGLTELLSTQEGRSPWRGSPGDSRSRRQSGAASATLRTSWTTSTAWMSRMTTWRSG